MYVKYCNFASSEGRIFNFDVDHLFPFSFVMNIANYEDYYFLIFFFKCYNYAK